jgi:hypothetical protein
MCWRTTTEASRFMRKYIILGRLAAVLLLAIPTIGRADETDEKEVGELAAKRLALMQTRMAAVKVKADAEGFPEAFAAKPIFRYSDPARTYVAAAVWKLGEKGRPLALVTTELHRQNRGRPSIVYEYLSLTPTKFTATGGDFSWAPDGSALEFKPVPGAPAPDATPEKRLLQLRAIAKRFAGHEMLGADRCELRLLPQPVDRYSPSSEDRADGALFLFTFGTNPEAALFIESDGKAWSYAAGRLAGATKIALTIDEKTAWEGERIRYAPNSTYTASNAPADIPGVAPDGSEIKQ